MRIKLLFLVYVFFTINIINSQVLYSENFDNLTIGSVGNDLTGKTSGQGGWYTEASGHKYINDIDFNIAQEPGRGKVLIINSSFAKNIDPLYSKRKIWNDNINNSWKSRDSLNNNILKIEYSFYVTNLSKDKNRVFEETSHAKDDCTIAKRIVKGDSNLFLDQGNDTKLKLPVNKWIKVITYLDYNRFGGIYYEYPDLNYSIKSNNNIGLVRGGEHEVKSIVFETKGLDDSNDFYQIKLDDVKISAVNTLPKLMLDKIVTEKFNLYPNPTNNIVNITNNENIGVEKIDIFDISGKLVQSKTFNKESEIQLNISDLASGTYMFHISTTEGTAVKKVVKK